MVLTLIKSHVFRCYGCGVWLDRCPQWVGIDEWGGKGHQCHKCGCTSVSITEGRPYGPRSKRWSELLEQWEWIAEYEDFSDPSPYAEWLLSTFVSEESFV